MDRIPLLPMLFCDCVGHGIILEQDDLSANFPFFHKTTLPFVKIWIEFHGDDKVGPSSRRWPIHS